MEDETLAQTIQTALSIIEGNVAKTNPIVLRDGRDWEVIIIAAHPDGDGGAHLFAVCNVKAPGDLQLVDGFLRMQHTRKDAEPPKTV